MIRALLPALLLLLTSGAIAQVEVAQDAPVAIDGQTSSTALRSIMAEALGEGHLPRAAAAARRYAEIGGSLSVRGREALRAAMSAEEFAAWSAALDANAAPLERSTVAVRFDGPRLAEAIMPNLLRGGWFASSVADGAVWQRHSGGRAIKLAATIGNSGVFGLAYDRARSLLWAAHSPVEQAPAGSGFAVVIAYRGANGSVLARVALPDPAAKAGDVTIDSRGNLFVADPVNGAVYRVDAVTLAIEVLANSIALTSAQGIAIDEANARLYVADYGRGIAIIPLDGGPMTWLASDVATSLDGTDGLFLQGSTLAPAQNGSETLTQHGAALVAIQNGTIPHRISRWQLSDDGLRVVGAQIVERAHRDWDEPTQGVVIGNRLFYIGNSQWRRFGAGGVATGNPPPDVTEIRSLELD